MAVLTYYLVMLLFYSILEILWLWTNGSGDMRVDQH